MLKYFICKKNARHTEMKHVHEMEKVIFCLFLRLTVTYGQLLLVNVEELKS